MKKYILILGLFVTSLAFSQGGYTKPAQGTGTVTNIETTGPITGGTITTTGTIGITQSTTSTDGYLNLIDWNIFNNKVSNKTHTSEVTGATALTIASGVVDKDNLAVALKTKVALGNVSGVVDIDTSLGIHYTMNMTGNITEFTFSNLTNEELKTITLQITGNFTIAQPASVKPDTAWDSFDGTKTNQIQIYLFDISTPTFSSALLNW